MFAAVVSAFLWGAWPKDLAAAPPAEQPASIQVMLPSDAKLTVDGEPTKSTTGVRLFTTPALPTDKDSYYTFKAEFVRGDATITVTRQVAVRGGQRTDVSLYPMEMPPVEIRGVYTGPRERVYPDYPVAPMSQQDPMRRAGAPGSNDPWTWWTR
jgi:uncharacterized protein (TIGR03000 family)